MARQATACVLAHFETGSLFGVIYRRPQKYSFHITGTASSERGQRRTSGVWRKCSEHPSTRTCSSSQPVIPGVPKVTQTAGATTYHLEP